LSEKLEQLVTKKQHTARRGRPSSEAPSFPRHTLNDALKVARAIEGGNAGRPFNRIDLANELGISPESSLLRNLLTSSIRYGLTRGGQKAEKIELTDLGRCIVSPNDKSNVNECIRRALTTPVLFNTIYTYFDNNKIPRENTFKNTLKNEFKVFPEDVNQCYRILIENGKDHNIIQAAKSGNEYLQLSKLRSDDVGTATETTDEGLTSEISPEQEEPDETVEIDTVETVKEISKPRVFISHSKNMKILDQVKQILDFGDFDFVIAEEHETTSIPISDKVFGDMKSCNCGLINISADDQEKREDGSFGINQNVLIEIGAAFLKYEKRVILLVDKRLTLPSNLKGLYLCYYQGDELSWEVGLKLQKALTEFKKKL